MKRLRSRRAALIASLAAALVAASVLVAQRRRAHARRRTTLVIDNSFTIKTSDPGRAFDPTASLVDHALYDTLFTYKGGDLAHPIPLLVSSYKASSNAKTYTFQLKRNVHFADGTPLTSADVVFSLRRLQNLKGNPSFLLAGFTVSAPSKYTVVDALEDAGHPAAGDPREPVDRGPQLGAREEERRHRRRERGQGRQGRELAQLARLGRRRQRPVHAERLQHDLADHADAEREVLGREEVAAGRASSSATWSPRRSCSTSAAGSHEIAVDLSADQARDAERATRTSTSRSSPRPGSSSSTPTTTRRSPRSRRTRTSRRRSATGSTTPRSSASPARARSRRPA